MLIIRKEQIKILRQYRCEQFGDRMLIHLKTFFPAQCDTLGDSTISQLINKGIKRASEYEITMERDVCKFIDLMFVLGENFDKDPEISWAAKILTDKSLKNPSIRMKTICDRALQHQRERYAQ